MRLLKYIFPALLFLLPAYSLAAIATPWSATSTDKGYISPNLVNGNNPWLVINSTGTSTFANGINLSAGCFSVGGVCISSGGGTPGGLNAQVQYNNAGVFGGVSGATTNGTILSLTNPLLGGATLTTSIVNGVTLTTGGSATSYLNGAGTYSVPIGTSPFTNSGNNTYLSTGIYLGVGTTTPGAEFAIHAQNGVAYPGNLLFTVGSSTASATTTLFSIDNQGQATAGNLNVTSALIPTNGVYLSGGNTLAFSTNSIARAVFDTTTFRSVNAAGFSMSIGATSATNPTFVPNRADTTTGIGANASGNLSFITSATTKLELLNNGNFGIGSTTPNAKLSIAALSTDTNTLLFTIASSTASATTTLFSISNTGALTDVGPANFSGGVTITNGLSPGFLTTGLNANQQNIANTGTISLHETLATANILRVGAGTDHATIPLSITGQAAFATAVTNLTGGGVTLVGGAGSSASAGLASGGNVLLDGGQGFGTGVSGNILLGTVRGNVGIGTSTPWRLLSVGTGNAGTFAISTSTAGCAQFSALGELYSTGTTCGSGSGTNYLTLTGNNLQNNVGNALGINIAPNSAALEIMGTTSDATANAGAFWNSSGRSLFTIRNDGNIGIGTTSPTGKKLAISLNNGDTNPFAFLIASSTQSATSTLFSIDNQGQATAGNLNVTSSLIPANGLYLNAAGTLSLSTGSTQRVQLNSTDFRSSINNSFALELTGASGTVPTLVPNKTDTTTGIGADASGNLSFITAATTKLELLNNGNVGIGTTSPYLPLSVNGSAIFGGTITATSTATSTFSGTIRSTCFSIDGTTCLTSNSGTVTSIATNNGITGGTITTTGTIGLAAIAANSVLGNITGASGVPVAVATSSLFFNASAVTSGLLTSTDWNTFNGKQAAGNYITALTGDVTASGPGSVAATLATVNSNVGTFGSATQAPVITVNGKGLTTAASNVTITPNFANVLGGTAGSVIYSNGTSLAQDNANFFWDGTNHRLGLASTTPGSLLSIGGAGTGTNFYDNATTTKNGIGGYNITQGCYAVNGTCLSSGSSLTGTIGQVAYFNGTNTAIGTSTITISTASQIGIGSTTPSAALSISSIANTAITRLFSIASSTNAAIFDVLGNGHIGVGTTSPTAILSIQRGNTLVASTTIFDANATYTPYPGTQYFNYTEYGAGGGGGGGNVTGSRNGGGGGAGAYVPGTVTGSIATSYTITIGQGGHGGVTSTGGVGGTGFATGGAGSVSGTDSSAGGGGGGSTAIVGTGLSAIAAGGGGGASAVNGGSCATGTSGGAGANSTGGASGAGGGGAANTNGSDATGATGTGGAGGTGATSMTGTCGNGGAPVAGASGSAGGGGSAAGASGNGANGSNGSGTTGGTGGVGSGGATGGGPGVTGTAGTGNDSGGGGGGASSGAGNGGTGGKPGAGGGGSANGGGTAGTGGQGRVVITAFIESDSSINTFSVGSFIQAIFYSVFNIDKTGHVTRGGPKPTVSACGSTNTITGNDDVGTITFTGTLVTACTMTFANALLPGQNFSCVASPSSTTGFIAITATSTTAVTFGISGSVSTDSIFYQCTRYQ